MSSSLNFRYANDFLFRRNATNFRESTRKSLLLQWGRKLNIFLSKPGRNSYKKGISGRNWTGNLPLLYQLLFLALTFELVHLLVINLVKYFVFLSLMLFNRTSFCNSTLRYHFYINNFIFPVDVLH